MKTFLAAMVLACVGTPALAGDLVSIVKDIDSGAQIQHDEAEVTITTTAPRVTPHDPPYTDIIPALCAQPSSLSGLEKVIVLNSHAAKGVEFWTYDETDDLVGTCEKVADDLPIQMYSVMH